jgi:2,3-bisphosphoglycerate-dependent phosphoglycerate mutase
VHGYVLLSGREEAKQAGMALKSENLKFDIAYTSVLRRASDSLNIMLEEIEQPDLPVTKAWELNERHYGALTGHNKAETAAKYGKDQVTLWYTLLNREWKPLITSPLSRTFCCFYAE